MATSLETEHAVKAFAWAANDTSGIFAPLKFSRRATGEHDVQFRVLYCGICHSDLHLAKNDWGFTIYPLIPGHEIVGEVTEIGSKVTKVKVGDKVGVGCLVGSCRQCDECAKNQESYCPKQIISINSRYYDGTVTYGGFSNIMVTDEYFIIRWPDNLPLDSGAPLLCGGITTYSPLRQFGLDKPGVNVGVVGLGGIGHLTVKFAKSFGSKVTVISTSTNKKKEAIETFGADEFLVSHDQEQMQAAVGTLDGIIDTVSANHSLLPLINLLKPHGKLILVGAPTQLEVPVFPLLLGGKSIVGTASGGVKETQDMLEFAAEHQILPEVEVIPIDYVNTAMERLEKGDVKYRFVIDVGNSLKTE
ncbi:UNVERIFIED_CONTAM: 8-hydroxygeraniol dehydrogenase [Sesamum latifolium]|uniref:8-hydroxygeraniol dehydrogenase n=1 Tax=Sesamum latifolium TaxID=2727402 RepID=A0AAW2YC27_9LAMI